jgi:hypothetical protein
VKVGKAGIYITKPFTYQGKHRLQDLTFLRWSNASIFLISYSFKLILLEKICIWHARSPSGWYCCLTKLPKTDEWIPFSQMVSIQSMFSCIVTA